MAELAPQLVDGLVYGFGRLFRLTQDSPVLPDVWANFATPSLVREELESTSRLGHPDLGRRLERDGPKKRPAKKKPAAPQPAKLDLLLTPHRDAGPAILAHQLRQRLDEAPFSESGAARIGYTQSFVVARLSFEEMVQVLLPLTPWWRSYVWGDVLSEREGDGASSKTLCDLLDAFDVAELVEMLERWAQQQMPEGHSRKALQERAQKRSARLHAASDEDEPPGYFGQGTLRLAPDLLWMINIIGTIQWARQLPEGHGVEVDEKGRVKTLPQREGAGDQGSDGEAEPATTRVDYQPIVRAACELLESALPGLQAKDPSLWLINRNRPATQAISYSRQTIKADAAIQLFDIKCHRLAWAVLDSGIDASHPAFLRSRRKEDGDAGASDWSRRTRVVKTYDFTRLRPLLDKDVVGRLLRARNVEGVEFDDVDLDEQLDPIRKLLAKENREHQGTRRNDPKRRVRQQLSDLANRIENGREIDWELLDDLLEVPHDPDIYPVPIDEHGTHVAGILAADWRQEPADGEAPRRKHPELLGMCPDIRIYDMRVLDPFGPNDEFTVLAALQFIQYLNLQKELLTIHGANLSLSIRHDVKNYACGRTPVCEECERLVSSGVVVVAASGNAGWDEDEAKGTVGAGYRAMSITDPGNAEAVITVGATHRMSPHTYGVSFFSSRGPTGDGRSKPDLVAPGEKITSTVPGGFERLDGTSMAAPHVSGAAALLMARHLELMGRPRRIKSILADTATDLGRERHFQGAGMLDVLRALQSV